MKNWHLLKFRPGRTAAGWWFVAAGLVVAASVEGAPLEDLKSEEAAVRKEAARRLGKEGDDQAVPALIAALRKDADTQVRAAAASSLGMLRNSDAAAALIEALAGNDRNVRFYAAGALGEIKEPATTPALITALGDEEWLVRDQAAWALREIGSEASLPGLFAALRSGMDRERIAWILKGFDDGTVRARLEKLVESESAADRLLGVQVLEEFPKSDVFDGFLAGAVEDQDPEVRIAAIAALRERRTENLREIVRERRARETDPAVRETIEAALADLSGQLLLVAHWSFDDRDRKVARDVTGGGSDGELKGGTPDEGRAGAGLRLGGGHHVSLGKRANLPIAAKDFTIAAWVKPEAEDGVIVARGGAACGFSLHIAGGKPGFGIRRFADEDIFLARGEESLSEGWTHLAGTVEKNRIALFVNGKTAASVETPGWMTGNCGQGMEIGIDLSNSAVEVVAPFEGILDEVRMYHNALSQEDLADLMAADGK